MDDGISRAWGDGHSVENLRRTIEDPRTDLAPTALRVLDATRKVIVEEGFAKCTLARIGEVSGVKNVAAVRYYFGSKSGLISTVLDTVLYDVMSALDNAPNDALTNMDLSQLTLETAVVNEPTDALRILFEMLPHILRDGELLERLHIYYGAFYGLHVAQLEDAIESLSREGDRNGAEPRASIQGLASLLSAIGDGLTIQLLVRPQHFDFGQVLTALDVLLRHGVVAVSSQSKVDETE